MVADVHGLLNISGNREYRLRANYSEAITHAGGLALILPHDHAQMAGLLEIADGLLVTGSMAGADEDAAREHFERALIDAAIKQGMPVLGICHGMQMIGQCLGGTLNRNDPNLLAEVTPHIPKPIPDESAHDIDIAPGSQLAKWSAQLNVRVNSLHRHALLDGGRYKVTGRASDGVVEAIEGLGSSFCMGVQWHPEFQLTALDTRIFSGFIKRCLSWRQAAHSVVQETYA